MTSPTRPKLLADVGGTNVRFALGLPGREPAQITYCDSGEWPDLTSAAAAFLDALDPGRRPVEAGFAVAAPVTGDEIAFTNRAWTFSIARLRESLGLSRLEVLNDLVAAAYAVPHLPEAGLRHLGGPAGVPAQAIAVISPGTGLGMAGLARWGRDWVPLASEGGHASFAATEEQELAIAGVLARQFGRVSNERLLSGPGLVNIYHALDVLAGEAARPLPDPPGVIARAAAGEPRALLATRCFSGALGAAAGDLALVLGARSGVYVAGGLCLGLGDLFDTARFRSRFEAKGRLQDYMQGIPTHLITAAEPVLLGLGRWLEGPARDGGEPNCR